MNILFFDLETTGLQEQTNGILEIAAHLYVNDNFVSEFNQVIDLTKQLDSGKRVSLDALLVNGVTFNNQNVYCMKNSVRIGSEKEIILNFTEWLLTQIKNLNGPLIICGQNVHFDIKFIKEALEKNGIDGWDRAVSYRTLDTSGLGIFLMDSEVLHTPSDAPKGGGLERLALALGIEVRNRRLHTAIEDVKLTAEVYFAMKEKVKGLCQRAKQN